MRIASVMQDLLLGGLKMEAIANDLNQENNISLAQLMSSAINTYDSQQTVKICNFNNDLETRVTLLNKILYNH